MTDIRVYNPYESVLPITSKALPGLEWSIVDRSDPAVIGLIERGLLVPDPADQEIPEPAKPKAPKSVTATKAPGTDQANEKE